MTAERIMLIFYCIINAAQYYFVNSTGFYVSDALGISMKASEADQLVILGATLTTCFLGYFSYKLLISSHGNLNPIYFYRIRNFLFIGLFLMFSGAYFFNYGKAEMQSSLSWGFIFRVIPTDVLFLFYLCLMPFDKLKHWIVILAYVLLKVWMGWTGMFLGIFWILFIRLINKNRDKKYIGVLGLFLLLLAFAIAPFIYSVKFYFRWGFYEFQYFDSLLRLIGRMGFYSNGLYIYENSREFAEQAINSLSYFSYFKDAFVAVMPRSLLGIHGENMETEFVKYVTGEYAAGITFYLGLLGKIIVYASMGVLDSLMMLFVVISLLLMTFSLTKKCIGISANPIIFTCIFQVLLSGSIEEISYGLYAVAVVYLMCRIKISLYSADKPFISNNFRVK